MEINPYVAEQPVEFTRVQSEEILKLEEEIAYFYGVKEPKLVADYYIKAVKVLEENSAIFDAHILRGKVQPFLEKAYTEVKNQTQLKFDTKKVASYEFDLIQAQSKRAMFENIYDIMVDLYKEVFQSNDHAIQKAALLRTFLYQYKIRLLSFDKFLSEDDISLLKIIAKRSEDELNQLN